VLTAFKNVHSFKKSKGCAKGTGYQLTNKPTNQPTNNQSNNQPTNQLTN
jgi:hypothetical protein